MRRKPLVMMVTDRRRHGTEDAASFEGLIASATKAAAGGIDLIQIREPDLDDRHLFNVTRRASHLVDGTRAQVVLNARTDIAVAAGARGVHLRSSSSPASRVRPLTPPGFLVGRSVHSIEEAAKAERDGGCDYLLFGTVFPSDSKGPEHPAAGVDALRRVCASVRLPVLAIGGVTLDRVEEVARAGAAGIAAIGLFARHGAAEETGKEFLTLVTAIRRAFERGIGPGGLRTTNHEPRTRVT